MPSTSVSALCSCVTDEAPTPLPTLERQTDAEPEPEPEPDADEEQEEEEEPEEERRVGFSVQEPAAGEEGEGERHTRLHRRDTPHHLKNKRIVPAKVGASAPVGTRCTFWERGGWKGADHLDSSDAILFILVVLCFRDALYARSSPRV